MTSAEICRSRGWGPGTVVNCGGIRYRITAVGRHYVLAENVEYVESGGVWLPSVSVRETCVDFEARDEFVRHEPPVSDPGTVRVRVAVTVSDDGSWCQGDWTGNAPGSVSNAVYFLTADLPVPRPVEVRADVEVQP